MAIELKQTMKLAQQLLITPQLQQAIKLLQLSRMELIETIQKELTENPVLEELEEERDDAPDGETKPQQVVEDAPTPAEQAATTEVASGGDKEFDWNNYIETYSSFGREPRSFSENTEELPNYENLVVSPTSLHDHLEWQVKMWSLTETEEEACLDIIGNLDENGYVVGSLQEISEKTQFSIDDLENALGIVQDLDPPGVGARDLKECLLLQVGEYGQDKDLLENIIKNHLNLIEKRNYQALSKKMGLTFRRVKELAEIILALEPKPGRAFEKGDSQYITPDVYVHKVGEDYVVVLNEDGLPKLQISNFYKSMLLKQFAEKHAREANPELPQGGNSNAAQNYIQDKLKSALWLIKSIHQRQRTLYKVTKSIANFQKDFMEHGVQFLKPLVLRDVADEIGVHESTVSRATNGKYVHTPQGIFELKYFFNTGLTNTTGGEDFANESVKQLLRQLIAGEDQRAPLSDHALANLLKHQNIDIARRTVAKYREMLGILPSSRRKRFC